MAISQSSSFERVFQTKDLFKGSARSALIWSSLATILLGLLLFDIYLVADLLAGNGITQPTPDSFWGTRLATRCRDLPVLQNDVNALALFILTGVGLGLVRSLMLSRARALSMRVGIDATTGLRRSIHRQRLRLGPGDLENKNSEHVYNLFTTETDQIRDGVAVWVYRMGRYPFELILLTVVVISLNPLLAFQCLIPLSACWVWVQSKRRKSYATARLVEDRSQDELKLLAESLNKTRLVRGYGMEAFEHEQFQKHLDRFRNYVVSLKQGQGWSRLGSGLLVLVGITIVLYLVGIKVLLPPNNPQSLPFSAALVLLAVFGFMHRPLDQLWKLQPEVETAGESAERIFRYTNQIPDVGQAVGAKFLQPLAKSLQFEAVTYDLPHGRKLLDSFDLKLPAGGIISIVSLDPLEAQALMYLLPRFIEPQHGRVLFDGEDIAWVTLESLRAETIYVGGADPFFTGTVLENITCGNTDYQLQDVTEASKLTHAHNFILRLPQGYETVIGEHGEQLDPGQGIRLGLARAILRRPAVLIIEEPTVTLDDDTKSLLDDAYNRIANDRTIFFLPSRLSTLRRSDRIVLLHKGKPAAIGNHASLVKKSQLYRHYEYIRFNEFRHETDTIEAE